MQKNNYERQGLKGIGKIMHVGLLLKSY
uniref:Uncharacterized protein n=1 Tax=Solanum lycopersicum TaxID=4081 RepID=A0A3Q7J874_SOLLC